MQGICPTHGEVRARVSHYGDTLVLHCVCNLQAAPMEVEETEAVVPLGQGLEPVDLEVILEEAAQGGGHYQFEDGVKRRGRAAALRYLMEGN